MKGSSLPFVCVHFIFRFPGAVQSDVPEIMGLTSCQLTNSKAVGNYELGTENFFAVLYCLKGIRS
jgi:hypothetical protein